MTRLLPLALSVALTLATGAAHGWGDRGHFTVNRIAVQTLPDDGPQFLKAYEEWITRRARAPDTWRTANEPFLKISEDPNHGWFREQLAFLKEIPRSRSEFVIAVHDEYLRIKDRDPERAKRTNVRWTGTLPYAAMETYERLKAAFRGYRRQQASKEETKYTELDLAFYMGWLGHYAADGAQPLHDTIHHDGWQGPNPDHYTRAPEIHLRFETDFVDLLPVRLQDVRALVGKARVLHDPFKSILDHVERASQHVEEIYRLDKQGAFKDASNVAAKALVLERLASGAELLRDLVYTAWIESARPVLTTTGPDAPPHDPHGQEAATGSTAAGRPNP